MAQIAPLFGHLPKNVAVPRVIWYYANKCKLQHCEKSSFKSKIWIKLLRLAFAIRSADSWPPCFSVFA